MLFRSGIDGHMDIVLDNGDVTGQSIAMQIKTGATFLATRTNAGFVFHGETKHLNFYMNSPLPVIIILCDADSGTCYFEVFDPDKTERTVAGWKMIIPFAQKLGSESKAALLRLVGPQIDHISQLEQHWAFTKLMSSMERILFAVDRSNIETKDTTEVESFFARIVSNVSLCEKLQGKIDLSVSGYESDPRELWQIPEVREWFRAAEPKVKYWFYFLVTDRRAAGIRLLFLCLCDAKTGGKIDSEGRKETSMETKLMAPLIQRGFDALNEMTERLGMTEEQNEKIGLAAFRTVFPNYKKP